MNKELEILNKDDVISVLKNYQGRFRAGDTLKVLQLLQEYKVYIDESKANISNAGILEQGIECEVLRGNSQHQRWRKGKIKFIVQFEPEETSNEVSDSLDDIRHQIQQI